MDEQFKVHSASESELLQTMLEEYRGLQEEIRLTDSLYMQSFAFGFTGIAAVIGVFVTNNNPLMQALSAGFIMPLICVILSYLLFLHQEHVRYTIFMFNICEYRIRSFFKKGTVFARNIIKTSRIIRPINSRNVLSLSPVLIMHTYQVFILIIHVSGILYAQYWFICLEALLPFIFLLIWHLLTRKMRKNIHEIKQACKAYFSNLNNVRAVI